MTLSLYYHHLHLRSSPTDQLIAAILYYIYQPNPHHYHYYCPLLRSSPTDQLIAAILYYTYQSNPHHCHYHYHYCLSPQVLSYGSTNRGHSRR